MAKAYVIVEVEDGSVSETKVIGCQDLEVIVLDWDALALSLEDSEEAIYRLRDI